MSLAPVLFLAHAFGQRYELPLPLGLFVLAGAAVVLLSFVLVLGHRPRLQPTLAAPDRVPVRPPRPVPATISLLGLAAVIWAGLAGSQTVAENLLPTLFWVVIWVGVALSCGLLGDWTPPLNPFVTLARLADHDRWRQLITGRRRPLSWPGRLGWWPAAAMFYGLVAAELIFNQTFIVPAHLALGLLLYALLSAFLGLIFGRAWTERGEVFAVLFATWGRLGYWRHGAPGRRGLLGGLDQPFEASSSRTVFLLLLLASVSFDGLLSTPAWATLQRGLPPALAPGTPGYDALALVSLAAVTGLLWGLFAAFAAAVARVGGHAHGVRAALTLLLPSLLPISFGYLLAHYAQYFIINSQLLLPLLGNPIGSEAWPLHLPYPFNDAYEVNVHLLPPGAVWYFSVAVIVLVHILAVVVAHRHLAAAGRHELAARRSEYPWIGAMVMYTMLSLWLLAQPLVK